MLLRLILIIYFGFVLKRCFTTVQIEELTGIETTWQCLLTLWADPVSLDEFALTCLGRALHVTVNLPTAKFAKLSTGDDLKL